ncbi:hypothetical protein [Peribacillus alkalitolerans]|uniref:hypothetical protein n=1 Tax=Peribacillus alkalitolerans TaxID=1550385 RepID=UPI0013D2046D|nr:hypothetical protein [Peribacillus alkalitolerans]
MDLDAVVIVGTEMMYLVFLTETEIVIEEETLGLTGSMTEIVVAVAVAIAVGIGFSNIYC